ncbi:MAG: hypothetical protein R3C27_15530 [Hyphomonadaceae bacterium]
MPGDLDADAAEFQTAATEFLQQLDRALTSLPMSEREAIVRETSQHLVERRTDDGIAAAWASLRSFGPPETYAAEFIGDRFDRSELMQPTTSDSSPNSFRNTVAICVTVVLVLALLAAGAFLFRG